MEFKDVFNPILVMNAGKLPERGEVLQVLVHPELGGTCRPLPALRADVDGVPLTRLHGKVEGPEGYERDCMVYEFMADAATLAKRSGDDATITVTDGKTSLVGTVRNLFGERRLEPEAVGADGKLRLRWVPGGDRVVGGVAASLTLSGAFPPIHVKDPELSAEAVSFALPEAAKGTVLVEFKGTLAIQPTVTACTGALRCEASRAYTVPPVSIERGQGP